MISFNTTIGFEQIMHAIIAYVLIQSPETLNHQLTEKA